MATSVWTGTISFGLVSIPVKLFSATTSHDISFNLLHRECKGRINLQNFCPTCEQVVERSNLVKGYQYEPNQYVLVEDEDFKSVKPEASSNLEILQFINSSEVDPIYYEKTYYLNPAAEGSEKPFALLTRAMEETGRAAVGKLVMRNKEYLALVRPNSTQDGLIVHFMLHADEIRETESTPIKDLKLKDKELDLAKQLVENLTEPFDATQFTDEYITKLDEMLQAKISGRTLKVIQPKAKPKNLDLMDALRKSVMATKKGAARAVNEDRPALKKIK
jgi:DNA end-binding protein Ku